MSRKLTSHLKGLCFFFFFVSLNICFLCVSVWQQLHLSVFLSYWWNKVVCCRLNHFYCRDTVSSVGCGEKNRQSSRCDDGESENVCLVLSFACGTYTHTHTHTWCCFFLWQSHFIISSKHRIFFFICILCLCVSLCFFSLTVFPLFQYSWLS